MLEMAKGGADGVLNAICFGCMMGCASSTVMRRIQEDHGGIPMTTLTFGGTEGSGDSARLEAFMHQVHRFHATKGPG